MKEEIYVQCLSDLNGNYCCGVVHRVPAARLADEWCFPGGTFSNAEFFGPHIVFPEKMEKEAQMIIFDAQTSWGLLFAIPPEKASQCEKAAQKESNPLWRVGEVTGSGITEII